MKTTDKNIFEDHQVNIIDFGFATRYLDKHTKEHLEKEEIDVFRGNMVFASLNQLKFYSTGRRDDLISLFYLLVYILKNGQMPGFDIQAKQDTNKQFNTIRNVKQNEGLHDICFGNTADLGKFMKEVFSYRFKDTPRYDYLRNLLQKLIVKENSKVQPEDNSTALPEQNTAPSERASSENGS